MMIDELKKRIEDLQQALDQSAGQHNSLVGRLSEAKELLAKMEKQPSPDEVAVQACSEAAA